jgi:hypothetical protein
LDSDPQHCKLSNTATADFLLYPKVKEHLTDITLTQDTFMSTWECAIKLIITEELTTAYP